MHSVRQKLIPYRATASNSNGHSQSDQRSQLLGTRKDRVAQQAAQAALHEENDDFMGGEQLKRALIEREQDEVLDDLGQSVMRLGAMGIILSRPCLSLKKANARHAIRICNLPSACPPKLLCVVLSSWHWSRRSINPQRVEGTGGDSRRS